MIFKMTNVRQSLVTCYLSMNKLSADIRKREEPENVETMEESDQKERLYMCAMTYEKDMKAILDIIATKEEDREKYREPVVRAQAMVDFPPGYKLSDFKTEYDRTAIPPESLVKSISTVIMNVGGGKETTKKKNKPIKKVDEWLDSEKTRRDTIRKVSLTGKGKPPKAFNADMADDEGEKTKEEDRSFYVRVDEIRILK